MGNFVFLPQLSVLGREQVGKIAYFLFANKKELLEGGGGAGGRLHTRDPRSKPGGESRFPPPVTQTEWIFIETRSYPPCPPQKKES